MELREAIRRRRMIRHYLPDQPVTEQQVETILAAAIRAPSAGNSQGWDFLVLSDTASRDAFWDAATEELSSPDRWLNAMVQAPLLILCLSHKGAYLERYAEADKGWTDLDEARWPVPYWDIDTGMAAMLMMLTCTDLGLGSCFFGVPPEAHDAVHATFAIPRDRTIVGVLSVGHEATTVPGPSGEPVPAPRSPSLRRPKRGLDEVMHRGRFGSR